MSKFKVGDKVRIVYPGENYTGQIIRCNVNDRDDIYSVQFEGKSQDLLYLSIWQGDGWGYIEDYLELINNNNNMNLIQQFKLTLKSEPEKTLIKTGIMNSDETLTSEGKDLFFEWIFQKNKEAFTEEVAKKILEDQEKENK